jgi:rare lipoprotein A
MNQVKSYCKIPFLFVTYSLLTACAITTTPGDRDGAPARPVDVSSVPDAVPRDEPRSRYGNPASYEVFGKRYYVMESSRGYHERGIASWYGTKFHGRRTSSGETYDMYTMTAAHKTLPLPTYVEVTNLENGKRTVLKVNDRGPFHDNRIIDLSYAAATKLGIVAKGTGLVEVRAITSPYHAGEKKSEPQLRKVSTGQQGLPFYIQVGAFSELPNAENLRIKASVVGTELVKINQTAVAGKTLYRVRIGPLASVEKADQIVSQLAQIGIQDHQIVTD